MNLNWIKLASDLIREAVNTTDTRETPAEPVPPPSDLSAILTRYREEIDKNFETMARILNAQNEKHLKAIRAQRKWNYGLLTALVIVAILAIVSYWRV